MSSFSQLNSLEAGNGTSDPNWGTHNPHIYNTNSANGYQQDEVGKYIFPAPHTCWDGPDTSYSPWSWWVLAHLGHIIRFPIQKHTTHHECAVCDDVDALLAH